MVDIIEKWFFYQNNVYNVIETRRAHSAGPQRNFALLACLPVGLFACSFFENIFGTIHVDFFENSMQKYVEILEDSVKIHLKTITIGLKSAKSNATYDLEQFWVVVGHEVGAKTLRILKKLTFGNRFSRKWCPKG